MADSDGDKKGDKLLYCSFCGKSQHEVRKLIAGPSVFVCDECVELCNEIIREEARTLRRQRRQVHAILRRKRSAPDWMTMLLARPKRRRCSRLRFTTTTNVSSMEMPTRLAVSTLPKAIS